MSLVARLGIGTIQADADAVPLLWALGEVFSRQGLHVQNFLSRGCLLPRHGGLVPGVSRARHLDSWLMSADVCREVFSHGCGSCNIALVEGQFDVALSADDECGGRFDQLCEWLDLPRIAVIDARRLDECRMPARPDAVDGILLDRVPGAREVARLQTHFESLWGVPVLGAMQEIAGARRAISKLTPGEPPAKRMCQSLGDELLRRLDLESLMSLATSRESPPVCTCHFEPGQKLAKVTVAVAYDEAFYCYFPDTLDLLELQGATIKTFSPLRDESLPEDTSVVYLGCGHPERWLEPLAENQCMWSALRKHVYAGGRLYAEGGGLAYLCEGIELPDGDLRPMVGVLPAIAKHASVAAKPRPVELTLAQGNWLGEGWSRLRGYLHNRWDLQPTGPLRCYAAQEGHEMDIVGHRQAIGSRIHLNFAAQPEFLRAFFTPHPSEVRVPVM